MQITQRTTPLSTVAPFSFDHSLTFLCSFPPTAGEQVIERRALSKALAVDGRAHFVSVRETQGRLDCSVTSEGEIDDARLARVIDRVRFQLSLDDDLEPFYAPARADAAFAPLALRYHGHHHVKFPSAFEIAVWAVLAQRNMRLGRRIKDAIVAAFGPRIVIDGTEHRAFPEPHVLTEASEVRRVLRDDAKADAIVTIARTFRDLDVQRALLAPSYDEADAFLRSLPRIGPWSSAFILFRGLGRMERLAERSDPILAAARRAYGPLPERELREIAERYGKWCGYWALYLRRS